MAVDLGSARIESGRAASNLSKKPQLNAGAPPEPTSSTLIHLELEVRVACMLAIIAPLILLVGEGRSRATCRGGIQSGRSSRQSGGCTILGYRA